MDKIIRCGVCGLGRIGWHFHLPAISKTSGLTLAAVADPLAERLTEAQQTFGVKHTFTDWKDMADRELIDLAVIASPTIFHREQCEYFISKGIDVFCDKPMALDLAEAEAMADFAKKHQRKLMVYQPHRLTGTAIKAKELIASGKLGRIYQIRRNCYSFVQRNDWQAFLSQGGGMLNNYGAHFIDQLLFVGGDKKVTNLRCVTERLLSAGDAEDFVAVAMRGESGILYRMDINMAHPLPGAEMEISGTAGSAVFQNNVWKIKYCEKLSEISATIDMAAPGRRYPAKEQNFIEEEAVNPAVNSSDWYVYCRDYFGGNAAPFVPLSETLEVMRILKECRESARVFGDQRAK